MSAASILRRTHGVQDQNGVIRVLDRLSPTLSLSWRSFCYRMDGGIGRAHFVGTVHAFVVVGDAPSVSYF